MSRKYSLTKSFDYAFQGIKSTIRKEPNFIIHLIMGIVAIIFASILKFSTTEFALLVIVIALVLMFELINTAIEAILDRISLEKNSFAKTAKDVSAAAVLIASILSLTVGAFLFLPKLFP